MKREKSKKSVSKEKASSEISKRKFLTSRWKIVVALIIAAVIVIGTFMLVRRGPDQPTNLESFAKCLNQKGAKMYGAWWCGHCQSQKADFGESWRFINYIECSTEDGRQKQVCADEKIEGYPTWAFSDGSKIPGKLDFRTLSEKTGCSLT